MSGFPLDIGRLGEAVIEAAEHAGVGVVITRFGETVENLFVSHAAARLLGASVEEAMLVPPLAWLAPEAKPDAMVRMIARQRGEEPPPQFATVIQRSDGTRVPVEMGAGRVIVDGAPASVVFLTDISDRWKAEQVQRTTQARFRSLIESAPDAIVTSRRGTILYANPAAARLLGYETPEAMQGASFADFLNGDDLRMMVDRVGLLRVGESALGPHEYRARSRDGRAVVVEVTSMLVDDGDDGPAVIGFARDVTDARRLQAQLMRADRLAALGTMAAGVAHEINNPLAFMMLGLEAIERRAGSIETAVDVAALRATVADVRHGVDRIAAIVRQLRTFSRPDESSPRAIADIGAVLDAAARMVAHEIEPLGVLEISVDPQLSPVRGEASQLEQVFLNLLLNAAHALDDRGPGGRVEVRARARDSSTLEVLVRDDGRGIDEEHLARVFDPFFTTKAVGAGTGLGLSICHSIVTSLGGEISVESRRDRGTSVRVILPLVRRVVPPRSTPSQLSRRSRGLRVLLADDEAAFLRAVERVLSSEHDIVGVPDGEAAWEKLLEGEFDVILLDVRMPRLSGMDLFERIRAERPALVDRVAFVTGGTARQRVERYLARAGRPILRKPFDVEKIEALLRRLAPLAKP